MQLLNINTKIQLPSLRSTTLLYLFCFSLLYEMEAQICMSYLNMYFGTIRKQFGNCQCVWCCSGIWEPKFTCWTNSKHDDGFEKHNNVHCTLWYCVCKLKKKFISYYKYRIYSNSSRASYFFKARHRVASYSRARVKQGRGLFILASQHHL